MLVILLIGAALVLAQNFVVLMMGMKEGAIWYAPLSFGGVLLAELAALWAAYICTRRFIHSRQALLLAGATIVILAVADIALPVSSFTVIVQRARRQRALGRIESGPTKIEPLPSAPRRRRFALSYTLTFPTAGHYLTFPAYIGPHGNRVFGDYDTTRHPEYYDEKFIFDAAKPYSFAVVFETGDSQFDLLRVPASIDICDGRDSFMVCRIIPIGLEGAAAQR
jgi:hypothetical protein